eukprot:m51a1_g9760 hypothetical protein (118) ;mRNA; f:1620051-1620537
MCTRSHAYSLMIPSFSVPRPSGRPRSRSSLCLAWSPAQDETATTEQQPARTRARSAPAEFTGSLLYTAACWSSPCAWAAQAQEQQQWRQYSVFSIQPSEFLNLAAAAAPAHNICRAF